MPENNSGFRFGTKGQVERLDNKANQDAQELAGWLETQKAIQAERQQGDSPWLWMKSKAVELPIWMNNYPEAVQKMEELAAKKK